MNLIIQNGRVLDPARGKDEPADLLIEDGRVRDVAAPGPYAVTEALYSGGAYLGQDLFYPSNIGALGELPGDAAQVVPRKPLVLLLLAGGHLEIEFLCLFIQKQERTCFEGSRCNR